MMKIEFNLSVLARTKWYEFAVRFFLGGAISAAAGLIAKEWGPSVGGLFLAFPAIFPASATLIEKHEKLKKEKAGFRPGHRGIDAAALDGGGSAVGSIGLIVFAVLGYELLPSHSATSVLAGGTLLWLGLSITMWRIYKACKQLRRKISPL